jgi:hypothetical protein
MSRRFSLLVYISAVLLLLATISRPARAAAIGRGKILAYSQRVSGVFLNIRRAPVLNKDHDAIFAEQAKDLRLQKSKERKPVIAGPHCIYAT